jgi:hypothetical protein
MTQQVDHLVDLLHLTHIPTFPLPLAAAAFLFFNFTALISTVRHTVPCAVGVDRTRLIDHYHKMLPPPPSLQKYVVGTKHEDVPCCLNQKVTQLDMVVVSKN